MTEEVIYGIMLACLLYGSYLVANGLKPQEKGYTCGPDGVWRCDHGKVEGDCWRCGER